VLSGVGEHLSDQSGGFSDVFVDDLWCVQREAERDSGAMKVKRGKEEGKREGGMVGREGLRMIGE
jgi:hypothetical protein